jgi:hypothetical protein
MRARQRHLNPVHAGANSSFDGRFISGLADDAAMSDWTGRSGSSLTPSQATANNQPKYKVSAINGLPGVLFDDGGTAANGKFFEATTSVTSNAASCIVIAQKTANVASAKYARVAAIWNSGNTPSSPGDYGSTNSMIFLFLANDTYGGFNPAAAAFRNLSVLAPVSYTIGDSILNSTVIDGTTVTFSKNGVAGTASTSATALSSDRLRIGAAPFVAGGADGNLRGYVVRLDYFISALTDALRRRLERGAGYSFKIACS